MILIFCWCCKNTFKPYGMSVSPEESSGGSILRKRINDSLTISLQFHDEKPHQCGATISFINTCRSTITINDTKTQANGPWYRSIFGSSGPSGTDEESTSIKPDQNINLFLGYLQFFGYIVLNYGFDIETASNPLDLAGNHHDGSSWWDNREYINNYSKYSTIHEIDEDKVHLLNTKSPFISSALSHPVVLGGKLGGVDDLVIDTKNNNATFESRKLPLLHDLIYPFNTRETVNSSTPSSKISIKELTDNIIPFYATSQSLLFSNIVVAQGETKSFNISFPIPHDLPPSYNDRLTGPVCDNGLVSIRYSLNVTIRENEAMIPSTVYFPVDCKSERTGNDPRWLQKDYFQDLQCTVDKDWQVHIEDEQNGVQKNGFEPNLLNSKHAFLRDLDKLLDTDLYNMPNSTWNRRKKSVASITEDIPGYIPQLPPHLKTSYQLRVNANKLCEVNLSRPFYHVGEDINYMINIHPRDANAVKVVGYMVHLEAQETFHMQDSDPFIHTYRVTGSVKTNTFATSLMNSINPRKSVCNGSINIPKFLSQQFQSKLLNLSYYMVFKFNLLEFTKSADLETDPDSTAQNSQLDALKQYRFSNEGSELKFRLKVVILP